MTIIELLKRITSLEKKVNSLELELNSKKLSDSRDEKWNEFQSVIRLQEKNNSRKSFN